MITVSSVRRAVPVRSAASSRRPPTRYAIAIGDNRTWLGPGLIGSPGTHATVMPCAVTLSNPVGITASRGDVHGSAVWWALASNAGAATCAVRVTGDLGASVGTTRDRGPVAAAGVDAGAGAGGSVDSLDRHNPIA